MCAGGLPGHREEKTLRDRFERKGPIPLSPLGGESLTGRALTEIEADIMAAEPQTQVIVTTCATAHTAQVHHHDFPEIRADGASPGEAALHLVNQLLRARDSALTTWRLEQFDKAIAEVKAFVAQAE